MCFNQGDLNICTYYNSVRGCRRHDDCNFLHICMSYIKETCLPSCKYNHDVFKTNCTRVLESHGISMDRTARSILRKLRDKIQTSSNAPANPSSSTENYRPSTSSYNNEEGFSDLVLCTYYNTKRGCKRSSDCKFLHMCRSYINKKCPSSCKYNHDVFTPNCKKVLKNHGIFMEQPAKAILRELKDKLEMSSATPVRLQPSRQESVSSRPMTKGEICTYNIRGKCNYGERCIREHYGLPYRWLYKLKDDEDAVWNPFTDEEQTQLEEQYCDVSKDSIEVVNGERFAEDDSNNSIAVLHFGNMEISNCEVVRKSTASSVTEPPNHPFTTEWMWYWEDNDPAGGGKLWRPYGQKNSDGNAKADKDSHELEESYQQFIEDSKLSTANFNTGANSYTLDFGTMQQNSETYTTIREVRRRPKEVVTTLYISNYKKEIQLNRAKGVSMHTSSSDGSSTTFPDTWEKTDGNKLDPDATFQLFDVKSGSTEYNDIQRLFSATCPNKILKIQRVQNEELWEDYARKRERMKKKTKTVDVSVNEKRLWHGTREYHVNAICQQNFDFRCSGSSSGTAYGQGSYFARDASYSTGYAIAASSGRRFMFLAKVLVGDYTVGNPTHRRPPEKIVASGQIKILYDSCVNQFLNPSIFVIFDKDQMYPEYLIEY
ncbi:protein mono-ADP-ribosyltransferase PARP12-like isoform X2 [Anneissia japonica]|nr:protein mono-ADP-ribosyltransferase PARP12-like isoform X2 [Anneissia japonica]